MEWLNIHIPMLRAPEYIGSEPTARATWLNVLAYCMEQENSGRVIGGALWKDRQWQQTCGVTLEEIQTAKLLLVPSGNDLLVWRYPIEKQISVQHQRQSGRENGHLGGRPPSKNGSAKPHPKPDAETPQKPRGVIPGGTPPETPRETGKGRGRGIEGEEEREICPDPKGSRRESSTPDLLSSDPRQNSLGLRFAHWFMSTLQGFAPCTVNCAERTIEDIIDLPHRGYAQQVIWPKKLKRNAAIKTLSVRLADWANVYGELIRLDKKDPAEIASVCRWARGDVRFWAGNFKSPNKLREKNKEGVPYFEVFQLDMMKPEPSELPDDNGIPKPIESW